MNTTNSNMMFCRACGHSMHSTALFCPACGASQNPPVAHPVQPQFASPALDASQAKTKRTTAGILGILLGGLGVHKFYLGQWGWGIVYLLFVWAYVPALLGLAEGIRYLVLDEDEFQRKLNQQRKPFGFVW